MLPTNKLYAFNIKSLDKDKTICMAPFGMEQVEPDASRGLCCYRTGDDNMEWNSSEMKQLRLDMLAERPNKICEKCYVDENSNFPSFRALYNNAAVLWDDELDLTEIRKQIISNVDSTGHANYDPQILTLTLGNVCIGQCNMCSPWNSSALYNVWKDIDKRNVASYDPSVYKWVNDDRYWEENLYPKFHHLVNLNVLGGEPFIIKRYVKLLKYCVDNNLAKDICHYVNTGSFKKPSEEILNLWTHFKAVQMELSIDDIQERNEYIRYPVKWSSTLDFLNWCDNETEDNVYVSMNKTVQNLNIYYVPDMIDWVLEQKFKKINKHNGGIPFHNVCDQPERCNIKVLPQELKQRIRNKYEAWYKKFKLNYNVNSNDPQIIDNADYQIHRVMKLLDLMDDNYMVRSLGKDNKDEFNNMRKWNTSLDKLRGSNFYKTFPIFKEYV
jgi:hypothetical protein